MALIHDMLRPCVPLARGLDFGAGDGWFACEFQTRGLAAHVVAVDVQARRRSLHETMIYRGDRLPFADGEFELTYAIDVLHHCHAPEASLEELLRCSQRYLLLKDHTYRNRTAWLTLCLLDEIGNRRFGIGSQYRYQREWEWLPLIESAGFRLRQLIYPAPCHIGPLGWATNRLQFLGLWERDHRPQAEGSC